MISTYLAVALVSAAQVAAQETDQPLPLEAIQTILSLDLPITTAEPSTTGILDHEGDARRTCGYIDGSA